MELDRWSMYLPPDVVAGSWRDVAGRLAWRPGRVGNVVRRAAAWRMAVLSAEVWWVTNGEAPLNVVRGAESLGYEIDAWRVGHERDPMRERWDCFCARCADGVSAWLASLDVLDVDGMRWRSQALEGRVHLELVWEEQYDRDDGEVGW